MDSGSGMTRRAITRQPPTAVFAVLLGVFLATFAFVLVSMRQDLAVQKRGGTATPRATATVGLSATVPAVVVVEQRPPTETPSLTVTPTASVTVTPSPPSTFTPPPTLTPTFTITPTVAATLSPTATDTVMPTSPATTDTVTPTPTSAPTTPRLPTPSETPMPPTPAASLPTGIIQAAYGDSVVVRSGPSETSTRIELIPIGTRVVILGIVKGQAIDPVEPRWWHIQYGDVTGYVYYKLLVPK